MTPAAAAELVATAAAAVVVCMELLGGYESNHLGHMSQECEYAA